MSKLFGIDSDPLALGTGYEILRMQTRQGGDWETIYTKDGHFMESYSADTVHTIRVEYYKESGATMLTRGQTVNTWVVQEPEENAQNRAHRVLSAVLDRHEDVHLVHVVKV